MSIWTDAFDVVVGRRPLPRIPRRAVVMMTIVIVLVIAVVVRQPLVRLVSNILPNPAPAPNVPVIVPSIPSTTPTATPTPTETPTVIPTATLAPTPTPTPTPTAMPASTVTFPFPTWEQMMGRGGEARRNCAPFPGGLDLNDSSDLVAAVEWLASEAGYQEFSATKGAWYGATPVGAPSYCMVLVMAREPIPGEGTPMGELWGHWAVPVSVVYYTGPTRGIVIYNYMPAP